MDNPHHDFPPPQPVDPSGGVPLPPAGQPDGERRPSRSALWWVAGICVGVVLLAAVALGSASLLGRGDTPAASGPAANTSSPSEPGASVTTSSEAPNTSALASDQLAPIEPRPTVIRLPSTPGPQFELQLPSNGALFYEPVFAGTADDLYVAEDELSATSHTGSAVSRYVDGELQWESELMEASTFALWVVDGQVIHEGRGDEFDIVLTHFDPEDGSIVWTKQLGEGESGVRYGDRYFVVGFSVTETVHVTELDPSTGTELNSVAADEIQPLTDGFLIVNAADASVQLVDLDLQPVGSAITIEPNDDEYFPWVVGRTATGWLYYANSRVVGLSVSGEVMFECAVSIEKTRAIQMQGESTVVIWSLDAAEGFDVQGSACESSWRLDPVEYVIDPYGPYIVAYHHDVDTQVTLDPVDLIDWNTGAVAATGEGLVFLSEDGKMVTLDGDAVVATDVGSGAELWRIDGEAADRFEVVGDMVIVISYDDRESASFAIYSD